MILLSPSLEGLGHQNHYFYTNIRFETFNQSHFSLSQWNFIMGSMARFSFHHFDFCCLDTIIMDRNQGKKQTKVFWLDIHHHVHMEHCYDVVDLECIPTRCPRCIFRK